MVPFRETIVDHIFTTEDTITETAATISHNKEEEKFVIIQTPNKQSTVKILAVPLPLDVVELLDANNETLKAFSDKKENKEQADYLEKPILDLKEKLNRIIRDNKSKALTPEMIDKIWSIGPKKCGTNILLNLVGNFDYQNFWDTKTNEKSTSSDDKRLVYDSSFINGFQLATLAGPMCGEQMQGVCFMILDWVIDNDDESGVQSHGPFSGEWAFF
jgi:ribosome assembly protein 1